MSAEDRRKKICKILGELLCTEETEYCEFNENERFKFFLPNGDVLILETYHNSVDGSWLEIELR